MSSNWPSGARELLTVLDLHIVRSRSVLILLANIKNDEWTAAIRFLISKGLAVKLGSRGYLRVKNLTRPTIPESTPSSRDFSMNYHDLISEVLQELDAELPNTANKVLNWPPGPLFRQVKESNVPVAEHHKDSLDKIAQDIQRILNHFKSMGVFEIIDFRLHHGCLWVLDGLGVEEAVQKVALELGVHFYFQQEGSQETGGRAAWWTKDQ